MPVFHFDTGGRPEPKTHIHVGHLPDYIDPKQPPTKKSPWKAINDAPFLHSVNMILPAELYDTIWEKLESETKKVRYAKVFMRLEDVLGKEFFTEYIKKGRTLPWHELTSAA